MSKDVEWIHKKPCLPIDGKGDIPDFKAWAKWKGFSTKHPHFDFICYMNKGDNPVLGLPPGTPVRAVEDGRVKDITPEYIVRDGNTVERIPENRKYYVTIEIEHGDYTLDRFGLNDRHFQGDGLISYYAHIVPEKDIIGLERIKLDAEIVERLKKTGSKPSEVIIVDEEFLAKTAKVKEGVKEMIIGKKVKKGQVIGTLYNARKEDKIPHLCFGLLNGRTIRPRSYNPIKIFPELSKYSCDPEGSEQFAVNGLSKKPVAFRF